MNFPICIPALFLLATGLIYPSLSSAQLFEELTLYGSVGYAGMKVDEATLFLNYVDESPSMDNLTTSRDLEEANGGFMISGGFRGRTGSLLTDLGFSYMRNQVGIFSLEAGIGYELWRGASGLSFAPGVLLSVGSGSLSMGRLLNNDVYIEINGEQYYGDFLNVRLSGLQTSLRPGFLVTLPITESISATLNTDFNLRILNANVSVGFSNSPTEEEGYSQSERATASNVRLFSSADFDETFKLPVSTTGLQARIGIVYLLR